MRRLLHLVLCLTLLAGATQAGAGEIIDRIVAVVNRGVVLQSDLDIAVRYQALLEGRSLKSITDQDLRSTLDRLIDQQLLF
jgi:parvulin-like peptidyl-prolyl isomerase